ncbi:amino acid ABC transporter substrate-binding protein [Aquincola sp. S2]|uniref:Amino acid ABC transporter substrate-binding protein n=1 Tax=Pseudaquabacterium terrae TaxID=2732868 RepID=A0ABX2EI39_9BURK|nr:transporter substrate-binding domain-containing protein [Aquabacterium terrae]NRF68259.1 amino acid ABC transporter substrate-binding protein [Aquabacterium terrae]
MVSKLGRWSAVALGWMLVALAVAQERVAVDAQNAPFMYADGERAAGVYPALLQAGFHHIGVAVRIEALPWSRALAGLDQAELGVGGIYKNSERVQKYDYSAPIFVEKLVLYVRRDKRLVFTGMQDLAGLRIGVIRGWSYGDAFDLARRAGRVETEEVASDAQNFSKLESKRLDAIVAVEQAGTAQLASGHYPSVIALQTPLAVNPTHLAFHKSADKRALLARFDSAIEAMRRSGEHDRLVGRALLKQP